MPFTLTMPKLSPTMESGAIVAWHKKEGDFVKAGEILFEVATDKATVEHVALDEGYLRKILVKAKASARVNQPLAIFTESAQESIEGYQPEGESVVEEALEPSIDKSADLPAETERASERVDVGGALAQPQFTPEFPLERVPFVSEHERKSASPLARKLAKEKGIDLSTVRGSGPQGRITSKDLDLGQKVADVTFGGGAAPSLPGGTYEELSLSPMREVIGRRLQAAKTFVPHFYVAQEIDVGPLVTLRSQLKRVGLSPSINDFIVRACALTLRKHPVINSGFNSANNTLIRFKTIDISIAVTLEGGLITPIVRHADYKNLGQLSAEIKHLAVRAREGKLDRQEYMGGSFTISNLGMYGISEFSAIINPPQAAILAVGGVEERAMVKEGEIVAGKGMKLVLSADHRVIDGREAAQFMKDLQNLLENPAPLLI